MAPNTSNPNTELARVDTAFKDDTQLVFDQAAARLLGQKHRRSPKPAPTRNSRDQHFKPFGKPAPSRIVAVHEGTALGQELFILSALEELKRQNPNVQLSYVTWRMDVVRMLGKPWFLKKVYHGSDPALAGMDDAVEWIQAPTLEAAREAEAEVFETIYQQRVRQYEQELARLGKMGVTAPNLEAPNAEFEPSWHQSQAHLWNLAQQLRLKTAIVGHPFQPYAQLSKNDLRLYHNYLRSLGMCSDLFILYHLPAETDQEVWRERMQETFPGTLLYTVDEIRTKAELIQPAGNAFALPLLVAALNHPHCVMAIGPAGDFSNIAWGAGQKNIVSIYDGEHNGWDGVFTDNSFVLNTRVCTPESFPDTVRQAGLAVLERLARAR